MMPALVMFLRVIQLLTGDVSVNQARNEPLKMLLELINDRYRDFVACPLGFKWLHNVHISITKKNH